VRLQSRRAASRRMVCAAPVFAPRTTVFAQFAARAVFVSLLLANLLLWGSGCYWNQLAPSRSNDEAETFYEQMAAKIDYSDTELESTASLYSGQPRQLTELRADELRPLSLVEAISLAVRNNELIRVDGQFLSPRNPLLTAPEQAPSIFDPAVQDTGISISQRGRAAALAEFDPTLTGNLIWSRDENVQNNRFLSGGLLPGDTLSEERADFDVRLEKIFSYGGTAAVSLSTDYSLNNVPARLFGSVYTGALSAEYRQPLLAGAGRDFTQIAGPVSRVNPSSTGLNQGIVIARINTDISLSRFEADVRNLVYETQQVYWDLYSTFQQYEVQREISRKLKDIWEKVQNRMEQGLEGGSAAEEAQAADNYLQARADVEQTLAGLVQTEGRLRRLLGLPPNDSEILHPTDRPTQQKWRLDWPRAIGTALSQRLELRRQKLAIRSLELQLKAAENIARPRLDFVSAYRVNAFGDSLIADDDDDGVTREGFDNAYTTLLQGNQTGWDLGFRLSVPIGFRAEQSNIYHLEFRLAKARAGLAAQELEISHELRNAAVRMERWHTNLETTRRRMEAADRRVRAFQADYEAGRTSVDLLLRAEVSRAQARTAYYRALAEYNKAITNLYFRTGMLLEHSGVRLNRQLPVVPRPPNTAAGHQRIPPVPPAPPETTANDE